MIGRRDPLADPGPLIRRVHAYVAYRVGPGADAEDITAETFARALRYRHTYDRRRGDPAAWLLGIARTCIASFWADRRNAPVGLPDDFAGSCDTGEETDRRLDLAKALDSLGNADRELLSLRYGADLTSRQIAGILGMRPGGVDVALHRARGRLRAALCSDGRSICVLRSRAIDGDVFPVGVEHDTA